MPCFTLGRPPRRLGLVAGLVLAAGGLAAEPAPSAPAKTHALFMGADVAVKVGDKTYAVRDVEGKYFILLVDGKEKLVTSQQAGLELRVVPSLKLAAAVATISNFHHDQGYSPASDPSVSLTRALNQSALLNASNYAAVNDAQGKEEEAALRAVSTSGVSALGGRAIVAAGGRASTNTVNIQDDGAVARAASQVLTAEVSAGADNETAGDKGFSHGFDALDVSFGISAPKPLTHPFLITITEFHTKGEKPGLVRRQIHARAIVPIDEHTNSLEFQEQWFPPGFEVKNFQLHLYDHGQEVATNVAPNYVALTEDEAFEYIKIEYLTAHREDTLKAAAVLGDLPKDFALRMAQGKYPAVYYVKVSKDGLPLAIYGDEAATVKISDPFISSVIQKVRFKPALRAGKPVDGMAVLNLAQIQG